VDLAFEQHGSVDEDLGNSGEGVLKTFVEKKADKLIVYSSWILFAQG